MALGLLLTGCGGGGGAAEPEGSVELSIAPAAIGQSPSRDDLLTPATVVVEPADEGTTVRVERSTDGGESWSAVPDAEGEQDADGQARVMLPALEPGEDADYRAVAGDLTGEPVTPATQTEVFTEDFDDVAAYERRWAARDPGLYHGRRMCASPDEERVSLADGVATLSVKRIAPDGAASPGDASVECVGGVWDNAMVGTGRAEEPFQFTYGTAAARMKVQSGQGMHSAFWLQTMGEGGLEIDTVEYYGDGHRSGLQTKIHDPLTDGELASEGGEVDPSPVLAEGATPADGWHVYSVEWTPEGYVFRVDGHVTMTTDKPRVADGPEEVVLSLLTSDWALDDGTTSESSTVDVDWVRVWQDPERVGQ
ncbi:glycoside hydrolase family 16 protein [Nocardioides aequoreus]|uniref:glycoside hydrolase family 16 protein n=1 Tax=Nocardioides aequoreus TaxID=397278 RepID=UPI0004C34736|nr:glycoside hydrolase family 16 protein [Nocardioides aequoreus]